MAESINQIPHQAILASAGSGKTFQLAHRYIRLMAAGVPPDRIIAITFSRKAAAEIFTAIVGHVSAAAADNVKARQTAEIIERPEWTSTEFLGLLRTFLHHLQRLHISTIDSFTIGILRAFPVELGVAPGFDVMNGDSVDATYARSEAMSRVFQSASRSQEDRIDLLEAFKQVTHGKEIKTFARDFDAFVQAHQQHYKRLPDASAWGRPERIWPDSNPWLAPHHDMEEAIEYMQVDLSSGFWDTFAQKKWTGFLDELMIYHPGRPWDGDLYYVGSRLLAAAAELARGRAAIKMNRTTYDIEGARAKWLWIFVRRLMQLNLVASLETTQGLYRLVHRFEALYDTYVRRPGLLTFEDAPYLLSQGGRPLSREPDDPTRLFIDFRLDSRLDHWLIDEFQDTSDLQWSVFNNLADEVLQDTSGARSFFFVGDVKQAIYAWRGGNHRLFGRILDTYGNRIEQQPLNVSFRSARPVLDLVNKSFQSLPPNISESVAAQWSAIWGEHTVPPSRETLTGYAALLETGETNKDSAARYRACADILCEIKPLRRGLTVAVLVQKNTTAQAVANVIRATCPDMPVTVEGASAIIDNPVVLLLLSLVQYASHPGDTLAWTHLQMSPLRAAVDRVSHRDLLQSMHDYGYQTFMQTWGDRLEKAQPLDAFGKHRLQQLIDASGEFDAGSRRLPDEYLSFIQNYSASSPSSDVSVRVMTIHKSKGLGFDIVLLPDLDDGGSMTTGRREPLHIARDAEDQPEWALWMPNKDFAEQDPVLRDAQKQDEETTSFENLCCLYVALTRAKRGLYLITSPPPKNPEALTYAQFVRRQILGSSVVGAGCPSTPSAAWDKPPLPFETGARDWFEEIESIPQIQIEPDAKSISTRFAKKKSARRRLLRVSPSSRAEEPRPAHSFFMPTVTRSLDLGTAVHGLFEQVEWSGTTTTEDAIRDWVSASHASDEEAVAHFKKAYDAPEFQDALRHPGGDPLLWREKSFEAVIDDEWVTGTFDRVVIERDEQGRIHHATILDFKTNDVDDTTVCRTAEHYRPQLTLYAQALSRLTGLEMSEISLNLCFTRIGRVVTV